MAGNVRGRLLQLLRLLTENTDEARTLTTPELQAQLQALGFQADRRTLYEDIEALNGAGWEVLRSPAGNRGYYFAGRELDDAEIGLLLDSLYTCDFLPEGQLTQLTDKLVRLGTSALAMNRRQRTSLLMAQGREHDSRSIYAVDMLYRAIGEERLISFRPYHLDWHKRQAFEAPEPVEVKPLHLVWYDHNYYLIAAGQDGICRHWRVDRLAELKVLGPAEGFKRRVNAAELKSYASHVFGPAAGRPVQLTLRCAKGAAELVYEKFGTNVAAYAFQGNTFCIDVTITPSRELYGWILAHGDSVELLAPESARQELRELIAERSGQYSE